MGKSISRPGRPELDPQKLYQHVRVTRDVLGLSWPEVLSQTGVNKSSMDRLKRGATIEATTLIRLMTWLGVYRIEHFTRIAEEE